MFEALSKESECQGVLQECSGESSLPEGFGLGLCCMCAEGSEQPCGSCLVQTHQDEETGEALMSQSNQTTLENQARDLCQQPQAHNLDALRDLLTNYPLRNTGRPRRNQNSPNDYVLFGSYAYGNQYGITKRTLALPHLCRYVNKILRECMPPDMQWTSFVLNHGSSPGTPRLQQQCCFSEWECGLWRLFRRWFVG